MGTNIWESEAWSIHLIPAHLMLPNLKQRVNIKSITMKCRHVFRTLSRHSSNCILLSWTWLILGMPQIASSSTTCDIVIIFSRYSIDSRTIFTLWCLCLPSPTSLHPTWNLRPARWPITIHRRIKKPDLKEHLPMHCRRQPIIIAVQMLKLSTQPSSIMLEIANVPALYLLRQDDGNTDQEIIEN